MTPTSIAAYVALFAAAGLVFLFVNLLVGRFLRPHDPHPEKLEVYECGEPTIGSSFVQFDLRFYVVALLFIIFDVEVAFFFPWATVFGKATQLKDPGFVAAAEDRALANMPHPRPQWSDADRAQFNRLSEQLLNTKFEELGVRGATPARILDRPVAGLAGNGDSIRGMATRLAWMSLVDIGVFFAVLMVGFFYVWRRGDLDWVRSVGRQRASATRARIGAAEEELAALSA